MTEQAIHESFEKHMQRTDDAILLHIKELQASVKALDEKLTQHREAEEAALAAAMDSLRSDAFPDADPDGHRRHHEALIKQAEARAAFWEKMKLELFKYGLLGFVGWAVFALWQAFLRGPK